MKMPEYRADERRAARCSRCKETVKNLFHLRFQSATDRLETPSEMRKAKQEVARIKTILRERKQGVRGQKPVTEATR